MSSRRGFVRYRQSLAWAVVGSFVVRGRTEKSRDDVVERIIWDMCPTVRVSIATRIYLLLGEAQLAPPLRKVEAAPVGLSAGQKAHKSISSCQAHRSGKSDA